LRGWIDWWILWGPILEKIPSQRPGGFIATMKTACLENDDRGLTVVEVLVAICIVILLAALILPTLARLNVRSSKIGCANNLKQIGIAFRVWEGDHDDKYPMSVSVTNGGTMELVGSGVVWRQFEAMSNELNTPKILFCPDDSDAKRKQADLFRSDSSSPASGTVLFASDSNTSYFIGVDATDKNPTLFLVGDRNLTVDGVALKPGLHAVSTNQVVGWTKECTCTGEMF